jgi:FkbM family methyltransferase
MNNVDPKGCVIVIQAPKEVKVTDIFQVSVELFNTSNTNWISKAAVAPLHPIALSYHWLDETGETVVWDGIRTSLANGLLNANDHVRQEIKVLTPDKPGRYRLLVTVVQEGIGWFERESSFSSATWEVLVFWGMSEKYDIYHRLGLRLLLDKSSLVDRYLIESGEWESEQIDFLMNSMRPFAHDPRVIFMDVGAYWGLYSLLAWRNGVNTIYAFDASRHNFAQLHAQLFLNDASHNITAINKAISDKKTVLKFRDARYIPDGNRGGAHVVGEDFDLPHYDIEAVKLDEMFNLVDHLIWIKMDVEGHEANVIRGMRNLIMNNQVFIQIEIFSEGEKAAFTEIEKLNLRKVHEIYPDRYFTNMTDKRLSL